MGGWVFGTRGDGIRLRDRGRRAERSRCRDPAGPAGARPSDRELSICVLEKGAEVGAHILSGACFETRALDELIPDWKDKGAPLNVPATDDQFLYLTESKSFSLPTPPQMSNHGNYIISLGNLCRWLAEQAEALGVEIYPGFAAAEVLYDDNGAVKGVATGDMGIGRDGEPGPNHQPGMELLGRVTLFAEGCRGSLTKTLFERFELRRDAQPQTYGIGIKELWEIDPAKHEPGKVLHTIGWPLERQDLWRLLALPLREQPGLASASSSASTTRIRISRPSTRCSASRRTRRSGRCSRAAGASATAPARSPRAGCSRCRSWSSRAAR